MAKVSVIIPCYNQGIYVSEAVDSVLAQTFRDFEIIIVNDGSTDEQTTAILEELNRDKTTVINTTNQGLAAARNNGISAAAGKYILPLDADDRIAPLYIEQCVQLLDAEPDVGIVYCRAMLFGAVNSEWALPAYSIEEMVKDNVIFCSALFRREDWETVGGYDTGMVYGWEDYDFWLSLIERGREVRQLDSYSFFYRVSADSMVRTKEKWQKTEMFARIYRRHQEFIGKNIEVWIEKLIDLREPYYTSRLYIDSGKGFNEAESISRKVVVGVHHLSFDLGRFPRQRKFRFDPIDCTACVEIEHILINGEDDSFELQREAVSSNAVCQRGAVFMFADRDPNIIIPLPANRQNCRSLEITINIVSVGEQSLREIIACQDNHQPHIHGVFGKIVDWWRSQTTGQR